MKKFKCLTSIILSIIVFAVSACSNNVTVATDSTNSESTTVENPALAKGILPINKITHYKGDKIADNVYSSVSYEELIIDESVSDSYSALATTFSKKAAEDLNECNNTYSELGVGFTPIDNSNTNLFSNTDSYLIRSDSDVVSVLDYNEGYSGGVHGYHSYKTYNYDTTTGKEISLSDVVVNKSALLSLLDKLFIEKYSSNYFHTPSEYQNTNPDYEIQFTIGYNGITFYYNEYLLNCYAAGPFLVFINYSDLEGIIDTKYASDLNKWITPFGKLINPISLDFDGDGVIDELSDDPYFSDYGEYTISFNDRGITFDGYYSYDSYVVYIEGNYYLYVFAHGDNDCVDLKVIDLQTFSQITDSSDKGEHRVYNENKDSNGYTNTYNYILTDPDNLTLETRFNIFSTYYGYRTYQVQNEGRLYANDELYITDTDVVLKTTAEITFKKVDAEGNVISEEKIPAGTLLAFVRTNGENLVDFIIVQESEISTENNGVIYRSLNDLSSKDGKEIYRLEFTGGIGERSFQGLTENEAFEICYYAG